MGFSVFCIWEFNPVDIPSFSYILNPSPIYFFPLSISLYSILSSYKSTTLSFCRLIDQFLEKVVNLDSVYCPFYFLCKLFSVNTFYLQGKEDQLKCYSVKENILAHATQLWSCRSAFTHYHSQALKQRHQDLCLSFILFIQLITWTESSGSLVAQRKIVIQLAKKKSKSKQ